MLNYAIKFKLPQEYVDDNKSLDPHQFNIQCKSHYNGNQWLRYRPLRTDVLQVITQYGLSNVQFIWLDQNTFVVNLQTEHELDTTNYLKVIACLLDDMGPDSSVIHAMVNQTADAWIKYLDYIDTDISDQQPDGIVVFDQVDFEQIHNQRAHERLLERLQTQQ